ncbi:hypothetical protein JG688_00017072 [Phytophthora aleatoria]|uniref:Uncharacterized protein n=1 Tax=Phytophthora aleatoria TaxID=2496075 RepID=A0A8J5IR53_9STRA|nr:hypothetical protein JG688_00017072 [Phytophthora aleatoria]
MASDEAAIVADNVVSERFGQDYTSGDMDQPVVSKTAVLKDVVGLDLSVTNAAVDAMIDMMPSPHDNSQEPSVVEVRREEDTITEWDQNGDMIAAAFPSLFMRGGKSLPQQKLGRLANSDDFRSVLLKAKADPDSLKAKRVNGYLLRILSLIGGSIHFSPFERSATRPTLRGLRARYGDAQHWVTVAPPEHHSLELHRIAMLQHNKCWNQSDDLFHRKECDNQNLPIWGTRHAECVKYIPCTIRTSLRSMRPENT